MKGREVVHGSVRTGGTDAWRTPERILDLSRVLYGGQIGLDPATTSDNPTNARLFYTPETDGLERPWGGKVFVNWPYSRAKDWAAKLWRETQLVGAEHEVIALIPARTDTQWWLTAVTNAHVVCFVEGRLRFIDPETGEASDPAPFPSALLYFGDRARAFMRCFQSVGWMVEP